MFLYYYLPFLIPILVCMAFSIYASCKVNAAFRKYDRVRTRSGMTGYDTAVRIMRAKDIRGVSIGRIGGTLTDHYHPVKEIVNLSESTYGSDSIAAVAVAAHEMGHVLQKKNGYLPYRIRAAIVPAVNIGSYLAMPLVILGLIIDLVIGAVNADVGFYIALVGVVLYGLSFLFALVTLPVELNASRRAKKILVEEGILGRDEVEGGSKVLSAAALTYLASLLTSLVYFLRFFVMVLSLFGRRKD